MIIGLTFYILHCAVLCAIPYAQSAGDHLKYASAMCYVQRQWPGGRLPSRALTNVQQGPTSGLRLGNHLAIIKQQEETKD